MFGSTVLELATGLVFVYWGVALLCSGMGDRISDFLQWRAIEFEIGLRNLVYGNLSNADPKKPDTTSPESWTAADKLFNGLYNHPLIQSLAVKESPLQGWTRRLLSRLERHNSDWDSVKPTSIPPQTFALALFDTLSSSASSEKVEDLRQEIKKLPAASPLRGALLGLFTTADKSIADKSISDKSVEDIRKKFENWFDGAMAQSTAIYKRNIWRLTLVVGILASVFLNVDTFAIFSALWRQPTLSASVSAAANQYAAAANPQPAGQSDALGKAMASLDKLGLPVGWQVRGGPTFVFYPNDWVSLPQPAGPTDWLVKFLGWLITGFAASQGAQFWFDALQKVTGEATALAPSQQSAKSA